MGTSGGVRVATEADLPGLARSLALAFETDPLIRFLFGDRPPRPNRFSERFFLREGARHLRHGHVYTVEGGGAGAYWDPPGHWRTPASHILRSAPLLLRGMGRRALPALRGLTRIEAAHATHPPHWYLAVLGTEPDCQGRGLGSALLAPVLARCDEDGTGAYLESSKEANIPFYERHGFEVVGRVEFPGGPPVWPMWRDPRPPDEGR